MAAFMLQWKDGVDATATIPQSQKYSLWLLHTGSLPTSALGHCFSNFNVHTGLLGILLKHSFWHSSSGRSLGLCISNKLPVILMMLAHGSWLECQGSRWHSVPPRCSRLCLWTLTKAEKCGLINIFDSFYLCPQQSPIRWAETFIQYLLHIQYEPGTPEAGTESHALIAEEISPAYKDEWKRKHNMWLHSVLKSGPQFNPVVADMTQGAHGYPRVEHGTG